MLLFSKITFRVILIGFSLLISNSIYGWKVYVETVGFTSSSNLYIYKFYGETIDSIGVFTKINSNKFKFETTKHSCGFYRIRRLNYYLDIIVEDPKINYKIEIYDSTFLNLKVLNKKSETDVYLNIKNFFLDNKTKDARINFIKNQEIIYPKSIALRSTKAFLGLNFFLPDTFETTSKRNQYLIKNYFSFTPIDNAILIYSTLYPNIIRKFFVDFGVNKQSINVFTSFIDDKIQLPEIKTSFRDFGLILSTTNGDDELLYNLLKNEISLGESKLISSEILKFLLDFKSKANGCDLSKFRFIKPNCSDKFSLNDYNTEKSKILLIIWSPNCIYCNDLINHWEFYQKILSDNDIYPLGIPIDTKELEITKKEIPFENLFEINGNEPLLKELYINKTPHFILLNKEAIIIEKYYSLLL